MGGWCLVIYLQFRVLGVSRIVEAAPPLCRYLFAPNLEWPNFFDGIKVDNPRIFFSSCLWIVDGTWSLTSIFWY
jgi:hypothetical protein